MSVGNPHLMEEQSEGKFASWWNAVLFLIVNNVNVVLFKRKKMSGVESERRNILKLGLLIRLCVSVSVTCLMIV